MITNDLQYRTTRAAAEKFERALAQTAAEPPTGVHPRLHQAAREGMASQLADLRRELAAYEALRDGRVRQVDIAAPADLGEILIQARMAAGLSQEALAARLGLHKQQVQRWEQTRYASASLARLTRVCEALGVMLAGYALLPVSAADRQFAAAPARQGVPTG